MLLCFFRMFFILPLLLRVLTGCFYTLLLTLSFGEYYTIALPQPSFSCFVTIDLLMSQYNCISSLFTALRASYRALYIRALMSFKNVIYSAVTACDISFSPFTASTLSRIAPPTLKRIDPPDHIIREYLNACLGNSIDNNFGL